MTDDGYRGQFVLSSRSIEPRPDWAQFALGDWMLGADRTLPVVPVREEDTSVPIGWLIGHAISEDARIVQAPDAILPRGSDWSSIEDWLYRFGGRWAAVFRVGGDARVYLDPFGSLGAVYSSHRRSVASTLNLLLESCGEPPIRVPADQLPGRNQFYPSGTTPDASVSRLLPNHFLDLNQWSVRRHWPSDDPRDARPRSTANLVDTIGDTLRTNLRGAFSCAPMYITLTAGRDSRMLLACCDHEIRRRATFITFDYRRGDRPLTNDVDAWLTRRIADALGLVHMVIDVPSTADDVHPKYLNRIGYCLGQGKSRDFNVACQALDPSRGLLTGFGGEVGRAKYWKGAARESAKLAAPDLLDRMMPPQGKAHEDHFVEANRRRFVQSLETWLEPIEAWDAGTQLDLACLEHRMGCWAPVFMYGGAPFRYTIIPFCHRSIAAAMLMLPTEVQRAEQFPSLVVDRFAPELTPFPYQDYTGLRRIRRRVQRKVRRSARSLLHRVGRSRYSGARPSARRGRTRDPR